MKIVIASHGKLASGYKSTIELLIGTSKNITFIDAYCDERNFKDDLEAFYASVDENEQVIMMSDLFGGSVNQIMYLYLTRKNTLLLTGINLPLVLELAVKGEELSIEEVIQTIDTAREALMLVEFEDGPAIEETDFF